MEWERRQTQRQGALQKEFPLIANSFGANEVLAMVESLLSGRLTMDTRVREYEQAFAKMLGVPHAVMVNSGSSANLLAVAAACSPERSQHLKPGDEVLVPAVCWATSVWPLVQYNLRPVFVDVDPHTLNLDMADFRRKLSNRVKGVCAVHILGNATDMDEMSAAAKEYGLILIEDTCESLGSHWQGRPLGTLGQFGTFSFYYSHHMTTGEGGMIVCHSQEDLDLLKSLRSHGWTRELSDRREREKASPDVDGRFLFVNVGYNLRPMEVQAAMGMVQLGRLAEMNENRVKNHATLVAALMAHSNFETQLELPRATPGIDPVWFGFCALLRERLTSKKQEYLQYLTNRGVENRPIVSGNFLRQPALRRLGVNQKPEDFPGAEEVHRRGFFIGIHIDPLDPKVARDLADILLGFEG